MYNMYTHSSIVGHLYLWHVFPLQYASLTAVCADVVKSLCSRDRLEGLLLDASLADPVSLFRVSSWGQAMSAAIGKLNMDFTSLPDIVQPFVVGLQKVHMCVCTRL